MRLSLFVILGVLLCTLGSHRNSRPSAGIDAKILVPLSDLDKRINEPLRREAEYRWISKRDDKSSVESTIGNQGSPESGQPATEESSSVGVEDRSQNAATGATTQPKDEGSFDFDSEGRQVDDSETLADLERSDEQQESAGRSIMPGSIPVEKGPEKAEENSAELGSTPAPPTNGTNPSKDDQRLTTADNLSTGPLLSNNVEHLQQQTQPEVTPPSDSHLAKKLETPASEPAGTEAHESANGVDAAAKPVEDKNEEKVVQTEVEKKEQQQAPELTAAEPGNQSNETVSSVLESDTSSSQSNEPKADEKKPSDEQPQLSSNSTSRESDQPAEQLPTVVGGPSRTQETHLAAISTAELESGQARESPKPVETPPLNAGNDTASVVAGISVSSEPTGPPSKADGVPSLPEVAVRDPGNQPSPNVQVEPIRLNPQVSPDYPVKDEISVGPDPSNSSTEPPVELSLAGPVPVVMSTSKPTVTTQTSTSPETQVEKTEQNLDQTSPAHNPKIDKNLINVQESSSKKNDSQEHAHETPNSIQTQGQKSKDSELSGGPGNSTNGNEFLSEELLGDEDEQIEIDEASCGKDSEFARVVSRRLLNKTIAQLVSSFRDEKCDQKIGLKLKPVSNRIISGLVMEVSSMPVRLSQLLSAPLTRVYCSLSLDSGAKSGNNIAGDSSVGEQRRNGNFRLILEQEHDDQWLTSRWRLYPKLKQQENFLSKFKGSYSSSESKSRSQQTSRRFADINTNRCTKFKVEQGTFFLELLGFRNRITVDVEPKSGIEESSETGISSSSEAVGQLRFRLVNFEAKQLFLDQGIRSDGLANHLVGLQIALDRSKKVRPSTANGTNLDGENLQPPLISTARGLYSSDRLYKEIQRSQVMTTIQILHEQNKHVRKNNWLLDMYANWLKHEYRKQLRLLFGKPFVGLVNGVCFGGGETV